MNFQAYKHCHPYQTQAETWALITVEEGNRPDHPEGLHGLTPRQHSLTMLSSMLYKHFPAPSDPSTRLRPPYASEAPDILHQNAESGAGITSDLTITCCSHRHIKVYPGPAPRTGIRLRILPDSPSHGLQNEVLLRENPSARSLPDPETGTILRDI